MRIAMRKCFGKLRKVVLYFLYEFFLFVQYVSTFGLCLTEVHPPQQMHALIVTNLISLNSFAGYLWAK